MALIDFVHKPSFLIRMTYLNKSFESVAKGKCNLFTASISSSDYLELNCKKRNWWHFSRSKIGKRRVKQKSGSANHFTLKVKTDRTCYNLKSPYSDLLSLSADELMLAGWHPRQLCDLRKSSTGGAHFENPLNLFKK